MTESNLPACFFDTSALIKHYFEERGSDVVDRIFTHPDTLRLITDITMIALHSAVARRVRMGEIDAEEFQGAKAEFEADIRARRLRVEVLLEEDKAEAARLIEQYGLEQQLRTLDAIQLAVMKRLGPEQLSAVYCADRPFIVILEAEGFTVINPETASPPSGSQ